MAELGVQLGLCNAGSPETFQLVNGYFSFIKTLEDEQASRTVGHLWANVHSHYNKSWSEIMFLNSSDGCW